MFSVAYHVESIPTSTWSVSALILMQNKVDYHAEKQPMLISSKSMVSRNKMPDSDIDIGLDSIWSAYGITKVTIIKAIREQIFQHLDAVIQLMIDGVPPSTQEYTEIAWNLAKWEAKLYADHRQAQHLKRVSVFSNSSGTQKPEPWLKSEPHPVTPTAGHLSCRLNDDFSSSSTCPTMPFRSKIAPPVPIPSQWDVSQWA
jgi:hypothetical protein